MTNLPDLKQLERKAFRSTHQDGLWDLYSAAIVASMTTLMMGPEQDDFPWLRFLVAFGGVALAAALFWAAKKCVTLPRIGQVKFGPARKKKRLLLVIILSVVVLLQAGFLVLQTLILAKPELRLQVNALFPTQNAMSLIFAAIGALFVGPGIALIAYFSDFLRGYYIAVMLSVGVFLMIWLDQPLYLFFAAGLVAIPGLVAFVRFLRKYPLPSVDVSNEH